MERRRVYKDLKGKTITQERNNLGVDATTAK